MNYIVIPAYQPDNKLIKLIEKIHEKCDFHLPDVHLKVRAYPCTKWLKS